MRSPHLLLASANCVRMVKNIAPLIGAPATIALNAEIERNIVGLFRLGEQHFVFGKGLPKIEWRQKISRFYYGAYNVRRSVQLHLHGVYNTDSSDHKNVGTLPEVFPNKSSYENQLTTLRSDRNLADYDHDGGETELINSLSDAELLVENFIADSRAHLKSRGQIV